MTYVQPILTELPESRIHGPIGSEIIPGKDGKFQWTIKDDIRNWWRDGLNKSSPIFTFSDVEYRIILQKSRDDFCLILHRTDWEPLQPLSFKLQMFSQWNRKLTQVVSVSSRSTVMKTLVVKMNVSEFFVTLSDAIGFKWAPYEPLIVVWKMIRLSEEEPQELREKLQIAKLQEDLSKLFLSKENSDVILKVRDKEFPCHKNILRARSPIFDAMFKHTEKQPSDAVNIGDVDPKAFSDFLYYLYTGSTKHVRAETVCQLYTISDKCGVGALKAECTEFMKSHLTVARFCDFYSLALIHDDKEVFCSATEFFYANAPQIVQTTKWQVFLRQNPDNGNELFRNYLSRGNI